MTRIKHIYKAALYYTINHILSYIWWRG